MLTGSSPVPTVRRRITVDGIVQGVGFRPFVHATATELGLGGFVGNDDGGVFVEVEGDPTVIDTFVRRLRSDAPALAQLDHVEVRSVEPSGRSHRAPGGFEIVASSATNGQRSLVPPDVATCDDCLAELDDPSDRRYRYPFINCTNCGPRFTIIRDLPYDRPSTTMAGFEMCARCAAEYHDPADRRHHAQPIACPDCGPQVIADAGGRRITARDAGTDAVLTAVHRILADGGVVAVKGLGGYHLAVDAADAAAVQRLRERKGRGAKPFAVMVPDLATAASLAWVSEREADTLMSPARPIVLLRRRPTSQLADAVAPGHPLVGVMVAYSPLHHLLLRPVPGVHVDVPRVLVMTSGNRSDEPICFDDVDARNRLADLTDAFFFHDRPIELPCDDSVVRVVDDEVLPIRRSRGYAPVPVKLPFTIPPVLGVGGELKNTCCVAVGRRAWVGQHVGDMGDLATLSAFEASVAAFSTMYRVDPVAVGVDRHPDYLTRRWAMRWAEDRAGGNGVGVVDVQHHHAHLAAAMAEHGLDLDAEVLGFAFDGTGYGTDDHDAPEIWGGEVLVGGYHGVDRVAHLRPLPLPGGDAAIRHPCRTSIAYLTALGIPLDDDLACVAACDETERRIVPQQVQRDVACSPATSLGRLFDAVSSLLGICHRVSYEAQAAIELEHLAERGEAGAVALELPVIDGVIDPEPTLLAIIEHRRAGVAIADLALAFHVAVADTMRRLARAHAAGRPVVLTGGVFQNAVLVRLVRERLAGIEVLTHRLVPPNDGGLSLGQAMVAAARTLAATRGDEGSP